MSKSDVEKVIGTPGRRRWGGWAAGALLVLGLSGAAVYWNKAKQGEQGPVYQTTQVSRGNLKVTVTATGTLEATGVVEVGTEISGKVLSVSVEPNDTVTKGQVLAVIDPVELKAQATQANAQVRVADASIAQAQATADEAKLSLDRAEEQAAQGLIAKKELETARATHARAVAALASSRASANLQRANAGSANWKLTRTEVIAPIDGVVLARSVEPGQTVAASFSTPVLFKLAADLREMELRVQVDEADIGRVKEGNAAEFRVDAYPGRAFQSVVRKLLFEPQTSDNVVTYEGILTVDNGDKVLRPGMTASATLVSETRENVVLVPNAALRFTPTNTASAGGPPNPLGGLTGGRGARGGARAGAGAGGAGGAEGTATPKLSKEQKMVYVLDAGQLKPVAVTPGASDGSLTEIVEGALQPGMNVVTDMDEAKK